jgi:hypothetical protein
MNIIGCGNRHWQRCGALAPRVSRPWIRYQRDFFKNHAKKYVGKGGGPNDHLPMTAIRQRCLVNGEITGGTIPTGEQG